jgi:hypothetical protein
MGAEGDDDEVPLCVEVSLAANLGRKFAGFREKAFRTMMVLSRYGHRVLLRSQKNLQ